MLANKSKLALLSGAKNFRAVEPYPAANGRRLRANTIYRSGELSRLTDSDLETVAGLNIQLVCDLRTDQEQAEFISRWPDGSLRRFLDLPVREQSDAGPLRLFELLAEHPGDGGASTAMEGLYRRKPYVLAKNLQILFEAILAGNALPVLIHCHAGKDRTGFITAMLLTACGVSRQDILDDYVMTAQFFRPEQESAFFTNWAKQSFGIELDTAALAPLVDARREYLEAAFQEIFKDWGSIDDYLTEQIGLSRELQARLQLLLLE